MVFHGPSTGCDRCRKAKKSCDQQRPTCARCAQIGKPCPGYKEKSRLRFCDQTQSVARKLSQGRGHVDSPTVAQSSESFKPSSRYRLETGPESRHDSKPSELEPRSNDPLQPTTRLDSVREVQAGLDVNDYQWSQMRNAPLLETVQLHADHMAMSYFFNRFAAGSSGTWSFLRYYGKHSNVNRCLESTFRACGMAVLTNLMNIPTGRLYAQFHYTKALGLLNDTLSDLQKCSTDESLIAVTILGYYEAGSPSTGANVRS